MPSGGFRANAGRKPRAVSRARYGMDDEIADAAVYAFKLVAMAAQDETLPMATRVHCASLIIGVAWGGMKLATPSEPAASGEPT